MKKTEVKKINLSEAFKRKVMDYYLDTPESVPLTVSKHFDLDIDIVTEILFPPVEQEGNEKDMVNKPPHYNTGKIEVIDYIVDKFMDDALLANVCKYISRAKHKGTELQDLKKAVWYLNRKIKYIEDNQKK